MAVLVCEWYPNSLASLVTSDTVSGEYFAAPAVGGKFAPGRLVGCGVLVGRALDDVEATGAPCASVPVADCEDGDEDEEA